MMNSALLAASCLLFVPGDRPERFEKAGQASPEGIVIDLEDAVPLERKDVARTAATEHLKTRSAGPPVFLRLNAPTTRHGLADLAALADGMFFPDGLVLPKVEAARDLELVRAHDPRAVPILAAIETARGVEAAPAIAAALTAEDGLGFGGADLAADLGADFAFEPLFAARCALVRAAAMARVAVLDVPYLDTRNAEALREETTRVRGLGFTGKLAIHPAQVAPIRAIFAPSAEEVERARRIVAALNAAAGGAVSVEGRMIDAPVAAAARRTLARARATQ